MENTKNKLKAYLMENIDEARNVVNELNSWNGCLESLDVRDNDEEFFETYFDGKPAEAVRAAFYGEYKWMDEYVRFNGYGNLESLTEYDLEEEIKGSIDDIVNEVINLRDNITFSDEIEEILNEEEEEEEEEEGIQDLINRANKLL